LIKKLDKNNPHTIRVRNRVALLTNEIKEIEAGDAGEDELILD
jgi:uncharacterized protein YdcH (DUF465 family)